MNTSKAILWDFGGNVLHYFLSFFLSIILARLLMPSDFALIGMVMAIISVSNVFVDVGLGNALIQAKNVEDVHYSSIFWINFLISLILLCLLYYFSTDIANYYDSGYDGLEELIRVLSFTFPILGFSGIYRNILKKNIQFKTLAKINISSSFLSSIIAIFFALNDYGVWSLVIQTYVFNFSGLCLLIYITKWYPKLIFKFNKIKSMWDFGKKIFAVALIDSIYQKLDIFVIGKIYSPSILGFYSRAKSLDSLIGNFTSNSLSSVLFSVLSKNQDSKVATKEIVIKFFNITSYISIFLGGLLYVTSTDLVKLMFGFKWLDTVPIFKIMVLTTFFLPLNSILISAIKGLGKSTLLLRLEMLGKLIIIPVYVIGFKFGLVQFLYGLILHKIIVIAINLYHVDKLQVGNLYSQIIIIVKHLTISFTCVLLILLLQDLYSLKSFLNLLLSGVMYSIIFLVLSLIFKVDQFKIIYNISRKILKL